MATKEFNPFLFYSNKLQYLFTEAAKQDNAAMWLYQNDVRTVLFMLEALTRLHNKAFDEKIFDKWNKRFKKLEDVFGQIDEYSALEKELKPNKKVSKETLKYFSVNAANFAEKCNQRLLGKDWLNDKVLSFDAKLKKFDVRYDKDYINEIKFALINEIDELLYFTLKRDYVFTKVEDEVHEIRRKLRWLSIYAQAFQGLIQLKKTSKKQTFKTAYLSKETLKSPFNTLPAKPKNIAIIEFDSNAFYALSWIIAELGKLKDSVLKMRQLSDAIFVTENITRIKADEKAMNILGFKNTVEQDVLKKASEISKNFIVNDKMLDNLLVK